MRLTASLTAPNATYNGADAITVFAVEGRNENALYVMILFYYFGGELMRYSISYSRTLIRPSVCRRYPYTLRILLTFRFLGSRAHGWNFASNRHPSCTKGF